MRDSMQDSVAAAASVPPQVLTTGTMQGNTVDLAGLHYRAALLVVTAGVITNGTHDWTIEVSGDDQAWTAAPAPDLQGSIKQMTTAVDETYDVMGYVGGARYIRASCVSANAAAGGPQAAVFMLSSGIGDPIT